MELDSCHFVLVRNFGGGRATLGAPKRGAPPTLNTSLDQTTNIAFLPPNPPRTVVLTPRCPNERPRAALRFVLHVGPTPPEQKGGEGHVAPSIQKDLAMVSYGCPADAGRDDATEGGKERCNTQSTFETSKYNSCNTRLKVVETLETCF
jgi:hypothetical protein